MLGLVRNGALSHVTNYEVEWGLPISAPFVDVSSIGAGGGSIARVDKGGFLRVGPQSAGADPGPACYGQGGTEATVTDANLVLGRLNADYFLGGQMKLDPAKAHAVVSALGEKMGMECAAAAQAIIDVADENMANAIRVISVERGLDPREFALVSFGGAGPLHTGGIAEKIGMRRIIVPLYPGPVFGIRHPDRRFPGGQDSQPAIPFLRHRCCGSQQAVRKNGEVRHSRTSR